MSNDRLIYLPLGGAGEIGMNAYVYGYGPAGKERLILVDIGVAFPDMETTPGVDLIFADISWLVKNKKRLEAVFITHAHEDHVGAIGHLYHRLGAPVIHTRAFTANIARGKLAEYGIGGEPLARDGQGRPLQHRFPADLALHPGKQRVGHRHAAGPCHPHG